MKYFSRVIVVYLSRCVLLSYSSSCGRDVEGIILLELELPLTFYLSPSELQTLDILIKCFFFYCIKLWAHESHG